MIRRSPRASIPEGPEPMAQHLCIVSRDNPLLLGYLNIALEYLTRTGDELEIVIDRRPDSAFEPAAVPAGIEQRRGEGIDHLLRSRGYAIVSRAEGENWRLSTATIPLTEDDEVASSAQSRVARAVALGVPLRRGAGRAAHALGGGLRRGAGHTAHALGGPLRRRAGRTAHALGGGLRRGAERTAHAVGGGLRWGAGRTAHAVGGGLRRGFALAANPAPPMRRRLAVAVGIAAIVIGAASIAIKSDALDRVAGVAGEAVAWLRSAPASGTPVPAALPETAMAVPVNAPTPPPAPPGAPSQPPRTATRAPPPARTRPTPPMKAEARPEPKHEVKMEAKLEPKREVTAAAVTEAPAEFSGVPRLEMRRVRDAAGHTSAIAVRVTDAGG